MTVAKIFIVSALGGASGFTVACIVVWFCRGVFA